MLILASETPLRICGWDLVKIVKDLAAAPLSIIIREDTQGLLHLSPPIPQL